MARINPGLTLDLHEYGGDGFWFSARHQQTEEDESWEKRMADTMIRAVADSGVELAPHGYMPGPFFEVQERGVVVADRRAAGRGPEPGRLRGQSLRTVLHHRDGDEDGRRATTSG